MKNNQHKYSQEAIFPFFPKRLVKISVVIFLVMLTFNIFQVNLSKRPILVGNESSHIKLLHRIVTKRTFSIDPFLADVSYYKGNYYSNKPPGYVFLLTPLYYIYIKLSDNYDITDALMLAKYFNATLSSLTVVFIFLFLSTFKLSTISIVFGMTAATFGTISPVYNTLANSIPLSIFLCIISILFFRLSQIRKDSALFLAVSLFSASYALIVDYSNGFVLLPLIVFLLIKTGKKKKFIALLLLSCIPIALLLFYNYLIFENPFILSYSYIGAESYVQVSAIKRYMSLKNVPHGLYGLLFSPSRGLFLLSPVVFLGFIASWKFIRKRNWDLFFWALMSFSGIIIVSSYSYWHGGHSIGYRHILPSAIILGMLTSFFFECCSRKIKVISLVLLFFSCFTGIISFFIQTDVEILNQTWKDYSVDQHANFYTELLYPYIKKYW